MVLRWPVHHFELESLASEVIQLAEDDVEPYLSQGEYTLPWEDAVERCIRLFQAAQQDLHCCQGAGEDQIDAVVVVHEDAAHVEPVDLRLEHQGSMTWARDLARVIRTVERDAGFRSAEVLRDGGGEVTARLIW